MAKTICLATNKSDTKIDSNTISYKEMLSKQVDGPITRPIMRSARSVLRSK